jgi:hypothetical protein
MFCFRSSSRDRPKNPGKNQAAHPGPGSQVHPTASSKSPHRHACPAIFPAPQPTVLSQGPFWETPRKPQTNSIWPKATAHRLQAVMWLATLSCPEAFGVVPRWPTRKKQKSGRPPNAGQPGSPHSKKLIPRRPLCPAISSASNPDSTVSGPFREKVPPQASHNPTQLPAPGHRLPYCCCWLC